MAELIGYFPSNQNTLYLLCLFYSDNEIITVCCRPELCTLIGWIETSHLCLSFSKVSWAWNSHFYLSEWFSVAAGSSLEGVKRYFTIRNKLEGVNEKLKELGVQRIDFDYETERVGFTFDRSKFGLLTMWLLKKDQSTFSSKETN